MNRIELLTELTGIEVKKVISIKPHHISDNVSIIFTSKSNNVFEVMLSNGAPDINANLVISRDYLAGSDINEEDVKDAFRTNNVNFKFAQVVVSKAVSYASSFEQWGITVDDLEGRVNVDRAIVSDYYIIDSAELKYNSKLLVVNYKSENSDNVETVYYVNYSPITHDDVVEAKKAVEARNLFGKKNATEVMTNGRFAEIITSDEFKQMNEVQQLRFNKIGHSDFYVSMDEINTMPTGNKVKSMIDRVVDNKLVYNSKYATENGLHQGHLSEMRNGKRDVNRMTLNNVMKYIDAYKY